MNEIRIGGNASGNIISGNHNTVGDTTINSTVVKAAQQDLSLLLAQLRAQAADLPNQAEVEVRIDDLAAEADEDDKDPKAGAKAFGRLRTALAGVASMAGLVETIGEHVKKIFG